MSSIYGIFVNSFNQIKIEEESLSALSKWNRAYGDYLDGRILEYPVGMGSFIDRLNDDIPKSKAILKNERKKAVIDAVIYNRDELICNYEMPLSYFSFDPIMYILNGGSRSRLDNVALLGAYCNVRYMVPYLDYRVIDYAVSIPRYQYLRGHFNRYIFREAFKDIMPHSLYVLKEKMENSDLSVPKAPDWFKNFSDSMKDIISRLDRDYWSKYINFDIIDDWMKRSESESEYKPEDESLLYVLFMCAEFQNVIEKARG